MVRVRFAPSPTGDLHVGNARTALINCLFARKQNGSFVLRIEDTDIARSETTYEESITNDLRWLGIQWDEGPFRQSDRLELYRNHMAELLEKGLAYRCFCTKEHLEEVRRGQMKRGLPPRYDGRCRHLAAESLAEFERAQTPSVVRFRSLNIPVSFADAIRGPITFPSHHVDDFIIWRQDDMPSYNFAVVVDDLLMEITHVLRGADHISNTPKQIMLFQIFGKMHPSYGHISLLTGPDAKPLSKRHGATRVIDFRDAGIFPEALANYLAIIGRGVPKECMTADELVEYFELNAFSASDAVFDTKKLLSLNREHLSLMKTGQLLDILGLPPQRAQWIDAVRENAKTIKELEELLTIFENGRVDNDAYGAVKKRELFPKIISVLESLLAFPENQQLSFDILIKNVIEKTSLTKKDVFLPLRVILTGRKSGPPLTDIFPLIPKGCILQRIAWIQKASTEH